MIPPPVTDIVKAGKALLLGQFQRAKVVNGILTSVLARVQALENEGQAVIAGVDLRTGVGGVVLDRAARIVGAPPRNGASDPALLTAILVQVLVNRSGGRLRDVLAVARAAADGAVWQYVPRYPASFAILITLPDVSVAPFVRAIKAAKAGGVRAEVWTLPTDVTRAITYGSTTDATIGVGYDSATETLTGGAVSVIVP